MNFNGYEVIDYEVKKHKLRSAKLSPDGEHEYKNNNNDISFSNSNTGIFF